jgi:hypothetical protein
MGVVTGARSLKSAVRKLEAAAAERQKACAYCRYQREVWPVPKGRPAEPEEVVTKRCEFCRAKLTIGLPVELTLHSYIVRENFPHTCERWYTDKSVHAFSIWSSSMMAIFTIQLALSRNGDKPQKPRRNFARENLEREYNRLLMRRHKRLRAKYGEPFPEHRETVNSVVNRERGRLSPYLHVEAFKGLYDQETHYLICAEMEKVFWGKVRPEMESAIAELRRQIDHAIAEAEERLRLKADEDALREKEEAEARASAEGAQARGPRTANKPNMKGLDVFDWAAYERQNAGR